MALDTEIVTPLIDVLRCLRQEWRANPWVGPTVKRCTVEFLAPYIKYGYLEGSMHEFGYNRRFVSADELDEHRKKVEESQKGGYFYANPYYGWHVLSEQFHDGKKVFLMTDKPAEHQAFQRMCRYFSDKPATEHVPHAHIALEGIFDVVKDERPEFLRHIYLDPRTLDALKQHAPDKVGRLLDSLAHALTQEERMGIVERLYAVETKKEIVPDKTERAPTRAPAASPLYANITYK